MKCYTAVRFYEYYRGCYAVFGRSQRDPARWKIMKLPAYGHVHIDVRDVIWFLTLRTPAERFKFITIRAPGQNVLQRTSLQLLRMSIYTCFFGFFLSPFSVCHFDRLHRHFDYQRLFLLLILKCGDLWQLDFCCTRSQLSKKWLSVRKYLPFSIKVAQDLCHQYILYSYIVRMADNITT